MQTPMSMPLSIFLYGPSLKTFAMLRKQPLVGFVEYRCSGNLKKQQKIAKNLYKILEKYL